MTTATVHTIPAGAPFVDRLADGILDEAGGDPAAPARWTVLLPSRRACLAARDAFLRRAGGRAVLLPRLAPIGDVDEEAVALMEAALPDAGAALDLPPALPPQRRRLLLTRLVLPFIQREEATAAPEHAARLADALARLLDESAIEEVPLDNLDNLVPEAFAHHWQVTLNFLAIIREQWPNVLAAEGALDPWDRRTRLIHALARTWTEDPPDGPVAVAGTTGSIPATAALVHTVATLPQGRVILPGLDTHLDDAGWRAVADDPGHPQYGLHKLLDELGVTRADVRPWPADATPDAHDARRRLVSEALRPAATTEAWRGLDGLDPTAVSGLTWLACADERQEATAIALVLRSTLEAEGRTAALITLDRTLARRVAAELERWGVAVDDSAGQPLSETPPGLFLRLTAQMVAEGFAPQPLLAALKHPLATAGMTGGAFRARVRALEEKALRGPRPAAGLDGLAQAAGGKAAAEQAVRALDACARPFADVMAQAEAPFADLLAAHVAMAEALAATPEDPTGRTRLWAENAGEQAAGLVHELYAAAGDLPPVAPAHYPGLLEAFMEGHTVRPAQGAHPRLAIWGPLEARLQHADVLVLGGLNEGAWPPDPGPDPWMSRPMRAAFGLPQPERAIGQTAHDFAQAACADRVILTRAEKAGGQPTVPARWLARLDAVLRAAGLTLPEDQPWPAWATALDQPMTPPRPVAPPAPRPPVEARPRRLSVTQVEMWMRDPYAIYARHILGLNALDPVDADPGAADYGMAVHAALDRFVMAHPDALPDNAHAVLMDYGRAAFADLLDRPGVWAFWWPRFQRIAAWFVEHERARRAAGLAATWTEVRGEMPLETQGGTFCLRATADRIDRFADGTLAVIDYKTGAPPPRTEVRAGYAPQLPLEGALAASGAFADVPAGPVGELAYWRLRGGRTGGEVKAATDTPQSTIDAARDGVKALIAAFDRPETPYESRPTPEAAPQYSDYEHLARVREWQAAEGEE